MDEADYFLQTFGELKLLAPDGRRIVLPERGAIILAYLRVGQRDDVSRETLAAILWPDVDRAVAFKNLRSTLLRMRTADPGGVADLVTDGRSVSRPPVPLRCDMDCFLPANDKLEKFRRIVDTLNEEFLADTRNAGSALKRWIDGQRRVCIEQSRAAVLEALPFISKRPDRRTLQIACIQILQRSPSDSDIRAILDHSKSAVQRPPGKIFASARAEAIDLHDDDPHAVSSQHATRSVLPRVALLPPDTAEQSRLNGSAANALIEDVTIGLCSLRTVSVVAPYTSERIRETDNKAAVLEKHGVVYALDTRRSGDGLFTQLIFLPTDETLWAERFTLTADGFASQRAAISQKILETIARQIEETAIAKRDFDVRPETYLSYLQAMQHLSELSLPSVRRARRVFRDVLRAHPDFAPALAGMARTLTTEWLLTARGDAELLVAAENNAIAAVGANGEMAGGHRELGVARLYMGKFDESLNALSVAENKSPHYADVLYSHADSLTHAGRPEDGLRKILKAIELNPLCPDVYFWAAAGASYFLGDFEGAVAYIEKMRERRPADRLLAASWGMLGDKGKARLYRQRVLRDNPSFDLDRWLEVVPNRDSWQRDVYREGLIKAGF